MNVELGKVFHTEAALAAVEIPYSLYIFSASKCIGVQIICIAIGVASCATLSDLDFSKPQALVIAAETKGGTVKPPAIVSVSRAKKII
jgi:hypothetical protein